MGGQLGYYQIKTLQYIMYQLRFPFFKSRHHTEIYFMVETWSQHKIIQKASSYQIHTRKQGNWIFHVAHISLCLVCVVLFCFSFFSFFFYFVLFHVFWGFLCVFACLFVFVFCLFLFFVCLLFLLLLFVLFLVCFILFFVAHQLMYFIFIFSTLILSVKYVLWTLVDKLLKYEYKYISPW
jgi:hypothetical protein